MGVKEYDVSILKKVSKFIFELGLELVNVMIKVFLIIGALCSILLLIKLYPTLAGTIIKPFITILDVIFKMVMYCFITSIVIILMYFIINYLLIPSIKQSNLRMEKRRQDFQNELINKITTKINTRRKK